MKKIQKSYFLRTIGLWENHINNRADFLFRPDIVSTYIESGKNLDSFLQSRMIDVLLKVVIKLPKTAEWNFVHDYCMNTIINEKPEKLLKAESLKWAYVNASPKQKDFIIKYVTNKGGDRWRIDAELRLRPVMMLLKQFIAEHNFDAIEDVFSAFINGTFGNKQSEFKTSDIHFTEIVDFLKNMLPFRDHNQSLYDKMVSIYIMGYVGYNKDAGFIPALHNAGVPFEFQSHLKNLVSQRDMEIWPVLKTMLDRDLDTPTEQILDRGNKIMWDPSWADAVRGKETALFLFSTIAKKRNKNSIPEALTYLGDLLNLETTLDIAYPDRNAAIKNILQRNFFTMSAKGSSKYLEKVQTIMKFLDDPMKNQLMNEMMCFIPELDSRDIKLYLNTISTENPGSPLIESMVSQIVKNNIAALTEPQDGKSFNIDSVFALSDQYIHCKSAKQFIKEMPFIMVRSLAMRNSVAIDLFDKLGSEHQHLEMFCQTFWPVETHGEILDKLCLAALCNDPIFEWDIHTETMKSCLVIQKHLGRLDLYDQLVQNFTEDTGFSPLYTYLRTILPDVGAGFYQMTMSLFDDSGEPLADNKKIDIDMIVNVFNNVLNNIKNQNDVKTLDIDTETLIPLVF